MFKNFSWIISKSFFFMNAELKFFRQCFLFDFWRFVWDVSLVAPTPFGVCFFSVWGVPKKAFFFEKRTQNKERLL